MEELEKKLRELTLKINSLHKIWVEELEIGDYTHDDEYHALLVEYGFIVKSIVILKSYQE